LFQFHSLLDKYVISLSSGELRKYQIIKTLLSAPSTLILDNPFIGLDAATRQNLKDLIFSLSKEKQLTIYLVVARPEDIPDYADDIIWITPKQELTSEPRLLDEEKQQSILSRAYSSNMTFSEEVVKMNDVSIKYGERTILSHVNWTIKNGECWALCGQNGSGKSTLLSLICADNPQAYACDISLFGRKRGSGESIWEIKRHIGYVSPEMHRSYHHNIPVIQVMASGLKDTVGLYTRTNEAERECCRWWMRIFGIEQLEKRPFLSLSSGEQRLVLVARAFVKDPQLLILDEPLHGLDNKNKTLVKDIIETYSKLPNKTLIMVTHYDEELPGCFNQKKELLKLQ
jgi:molybdate transport system ATP-binding protein